MKNKREQIINGLRTLQGECRKISDADCHSNCPYEDICLSIRAVGYGAKAHGTPDMWDLGKIKGSTK